MTAVSLAADRLRLGETFFVAFQRTLRIPDDNRTYPLPPGLGRLPLRRLEGGEGPQGAPRVVVPLRRREAMWLGFDAPSWRPHALLVGLGGVNAVSGGQWAPVLSATPQNYLVCPPQLWLDGVTVAQGRVRQFLATPLGTGTTVEAQLASGADEGTLRFIVFEPQAGHFPDRPPSEASRPARMRAAGGIGLGAGGQIRQRVYPDPYGVHIWDPTECVSAEVRLVTAHAFEALTGEQAPPTPVDADTYTSHGFPWFDLYDESADALPATPEMERVRSVGDVEGTKGADHSLDIHESQITRLEPRRKPS